MAATIAIKSNCRSISSSPISTTHIVRLSHARTAHTHPDIRVQTEKRHPVVAMTGVTAMFWSKLVYGLTFISLKLYVFVYRIKCWTVFVSFDKRKCLHFECFAGHRVRKVFVSMMCCFHLISLNKNSICMEWMVRKASITNTRQLYLPSAPIFAFCAPLTSLQSGTEVSSCVKGRSLDPHKWLCWRKLKMV